MITGNKGNASGAGVYNSGTFTLNKGTIKSNVCGAASTADGVHIASGSFTMVDGTIDATAPTESNTYREAVRLAGGTAKIQGGTILGGDTALTVAGGTATVSGGSFDGTLTETAEDTLAISGGKFSTKPDVDWLATNAGPLSIVDNTDSDSATYDYKVVKGFVSQGEFMDFQSSLNLGLYLNADVGFDTPTAEGYTATVTGGYTPALSVSNGNLLVMAEGIAAKKMHDDITFTVKDNDGNVMFTDTVSVYEAAQKWQNDDNKADDILVADMINYGVEAQKAFGYTVGADMTGGTTTNPTWTATNGAGVTTGYEDKVAVTLSLKEQIELNIYINDADAEVSNVVGADAPEVERVSNITRISFRDIPVVGVKNAVSFTVKLADNNSFDVTYSIKDYVINALADESNQQKDLLVALQKYVDAVSAYVPQ